MRINLLVHVALTSCNTEVLDDFGLYSVLMEIFFSPLQANQAFVKDVRGNIFAVSKVKVNFVYPVHVFAINDYVYSVLFRLLKGDTNLIHARFFLLLSLLSKTSLLR